MMTRRKFTLFSTALICMVLGMCFLPQAVTAAELPALAGTVHWWPGDGNLNDIGFASNNTYSDNDGSEVDGSVDFNTGKVSKGMAGSGVVRVANAANLKFGTGDFSGCLWVKMSGAGMLIEKDIPDPGNQSWFVWNDGTRVNFVVGGGGTDYTAKSITDISDNNWHFVSWVRDGTAVRIYVDGTRERTSTTPSIINVNNDNPLIFGGEYDDVNNVYLNKVSATIDEVMLFNRALSTGEIQDIYNAGSDGVHKNKAPVLTGPQTVNEGQALSFVVATDFAGQGLTVTASGLPAGATLSGRTFSWTPSFSQAGTYAVTFTAKDNWLPIKSTTGQVSITVKNVNRPPVAANDVATTDEDAAVSIAVKANDSDPDGDAITLTAVTQGTKGSVVINANQTVKYTPSANFNGSNSFTYTLSDGKGGTDIATVSVTVRAVNDAPSFVKGPNQTVPENAGPQLVANWATSLSAGPADESGQVLDFLVSNNNNGLFSDQPAVNAAGTLTYTPASNTSGTAIVTVQLHDNGGTANGGVDTSPAQTFVISVNEVIAVNPPPVAVNDAATTDEDAAVDITVMANDSDPNGDALSLSAVAPGANGSTAINGDGTVKYTPNADFNGEDSFTYTIDDGNGGTAAASVSVTIAPVNDAPGFTKGGDQVVDEDSGAQTLADWATAIFAGPTDESGQTLTFELTNDNNGLFSAPPAIAADGTLSYTPAPDANGIASVTVVLKDDGGTASGGVDTSTPQTFAITVNPVNDPPTFVQGANQVVDEDAGAQVVPGWATQISPGPADEATQAVTFAVTGGDESLFAVLPAIAADGTLTYTPAPDANGSAKLMVSLTDDGGGVPSKGKGDKEGLGQVFVITVNPVNDAPSFTRGADQEVLDNAGPQSVANWATDISAGPADEAGQTLDFLVSNDNDGLFAAPPAVDASGTLTYAPAPNASGTANVTVRIHDDGGTDKGGVDTSAPQTFAITVKLSNRPPAANAGPDQHLEAAGPTTAVQLDGSGSSDPDGDALSYSWSENGTLVSAQVSPTLTLAKGSHTFALTVADGRGGSASDEVVVTIVDTTPPVVSLSGPVTVTLECHLGTYTEAGATALDACDGNLPIATTGSLDVNTVGTYTLSYTATDSHGNVGNIVTRTINVVDTTPPVVSLTGSAELTLECHLGTYTEAGASALDACDGNLPVVSSGTVDINTVGTYTLSYTAADHHGNAGNIVTRTINVVDTTPPVVSLNGDATVTIECHLGAYTEAGASALDACDGALPVAISGSVDVNTVGTYTLTYSATDASGNSASLSRTVNVVDTTPPALALNGTNPLQLIRPITYVEAGAVVSDACDEHPALVITGSVNANIPGTYTITYTATDVSGNQTTATRTVEVLNREPICALAAPSIAEVWPPNHKMVDISILSVTDPDGDLVTIAVTGITQDEPINTYSDGDTGPDGAGVGTSTAQVRAERAGSKKVPGNGRVYVISFTATDNFGASCAGKVTVRVPHDQGKGSCIDDGQKYNSVTGGLTGPAAKLAATSEEDGVGMGNYPNPFNPATTIVYNLPDASLVRLAVYNALGQQVRMLVEEVQGAGGYAVEWNGLDATGQQVAGGVYFYRLEAGEHIQVRKMLFAK